MTRHEYNKLKENLMNYGDFSGKSTKSLSEEFNVSQYSMRKALDDVGIFLNREYNGINLDARNAEIIKLYHSGETYEYIADKYGISRQRVHQIIRKYDKDNRNYVKKYNIHIKTDSIKYIGLRNYLNENNMNKTDLYLLGSKVFPKYAQFCMQLKGTNPLRVDTINEILRITGMTYEQCFNINS